MFKFSRDITGIKIIEDSSLESLVFVRSKAAVVFGALLVFIFMTSWVGMFCYWIVEELQNPSKGNIFILIAIVFILFALYMSIRVIPKIKESYGECIVIDKSDGTVIRNSRLISNLSELKDIWLEEIINYDSSNDLNLYLRFSNGTNLLIDSGIDVDRVDHLNKKLEQFLDKNTFRSKNV